MSFEYCCLIAKKEKIFLTESNYRDFPSYSKRIMPLLNTMITGDKAHSIEIEMEKTVSYLRVKKVIFVCVHGSNIGFNKYKLFLEQFIYLTQNEIGNINDIFKSEKISKHCLNHRLSDKMNTLLKSFDNLMWNTRVSILKVKSDISELKEDLDKQLRQVMNNNLNELLVKEEPIEDEEPIPTPEPEILENKNKSYKSYMIYVLIVLLVSFMVYLIYSIFKCRSAFCAN